LRIDIPLLPIFVEVRWRPLRPFRVSIRGLMLTVIMAGLFFSLVAENHRLDRAVKYHGRRTIDQNKQWRPPPYGPTSLENWHLMKMTEYRAAHDRVDFIVFVLVMATASLGVVAALGRILHWFFRRSFTPPKDELSPPSRSDVGRGC
jgi:hypothetical protein